MKKLLFPIMLMAAVCSHAFTVVTRSSDSSISYQANDISKVVLTHAGGANIYLVDNSVVEIPADKFLSISFDGTEGLSETEAGSFFVADGGCLRSIDESPIEIYDASGCLVASSQNGRVNIMPFNEGVYIVKCLGASAKIYIR